jgi:hypothetical protein
MQTEIKPKRGGPRPGGGRRPGYKAPATIKKLAIKTLQQIMQDETASPDGCESYGCLQIDR